MSDLAKFAKDNKVKFFLFNFTDLFGVQRAKLVPAEAVGKMQKAGAGFAGFATWLDQTPAHPDILVMPDPNSVIQLPWRPEVAWVAGEPWMNGEPLAQSPRVVLRKMAEKHAAKNMKLMAGVEPEFHLINADGTAVSDPRDTQEKPCYDQAAIMRRLDVIGEICSTMTQLGWGPYQNDHEDANGQFEINWNFNDALTTADQLAFFKFMVKSIAEKHGLRATFMPKPFINLTGNGCHVHLSVWDKSGKTNLFDDAKGELGLSPLGLQLPRRPDAPCRRHGGHHQSDGEQLQAHQRAAHRLGRDLVAVLHHLRRQQPHPHGAHPRRGPCRVPPAGQCRQSLPAAGRHPGRRHAWGGGEDGPRQAPRHRHVCRGPHREGRQEAAAQPAGCAAQLRG